MEARLRHVFRDLSCLTHPCTGAPDGDFENLPVPTLYTSMKTRLDSQISDEVG